MAYQGHIVVPTTHEDAQDAIEHVKRMATGRFGGVSVYEGNGAWDGESGIESEDHCRIVFNVPDDDHFDREQIMEYLRFECQYIKDNLGEEAVLFELHEMDMELV